MAKVNMEKLKIILTKMRETFSFDVEAVALSIENAVLVKDVLTKEELTEIVSKQIDDYMNNKALQVAVSTETFDDKAQEAGAIAVSIANSNKGEDISRIELIKKAFQELSKNQDLFKELDINNLLPGLIRKEYA